LAIAVGNTLSSLTMDVPQVFWFIIIPLILSFLKALTFEVDWREKYNKNLAEEYQKQLGSDIKNHPFITFMSNKIVFFFSYKKITLLYPRKTLSPLLKSTTKT
jgi:choline-glycine betaine transporter